MRTTASVDSWIVGSGTFANPPYLPGTSSPKLVHLHKPALISGLFTGVRRIGILRTSPFGDSRKFALKEFSEVALSSEPCYIGCERSGGERVGKESCRVRQSKHFGGFSSTNR